MKYLFLILALSTMCWAEDMVILKDESKVSAENTILKGNTIVVPGQNVISTKDIKEIYFNAQKEKKQAVNTDKSVPAEITAIIKEAQEFAAQYPDSGMHALIDEVEYEYFSDGRSISTTHFRGLISKETHKGYGVGGTYFIEGRDRVELIMARTIKPDGTVVMFDPANVKISKPSGRGDSFTAGSTFIFNLPDVEVGSIIEYSYRQETYKPAKKEFFFPSALLQSTEPVKLARLKIIIPESENLYYYANNFPGGKSSPKIENENGKKVYTWELHNPPLIIREPSMPDIRDCAAYVYATVFNDWNVVYDWLQSYYVENCTPSPELTKHTLEIVKDCTTDEEKIAAIYHWIQQNIRYIIIKGDMSSIFGSYKGDITLQRKFGCCVDKAVLFSGMLNAVGIKSTPVLLNTTGGDDVNPAIPRIYLEHAISCVYVNGKRMYLDSTGYDSRYPSFSVGDQGVWCVNPMDREQQYIPQGEPSSMLAAYTNIINMDEEGNCTVKFWTKYNGDYESWIRGYWKSVKESERKQRFQQMCNSISPNSELLSYNLINLDDISKPFSMRKEYKLYNYPTFASDIVIFPLPGFDYYFSEVHLEKRNYDIEYHYPYLKQNTYIINIPENMEVMYVPESLDISHKYFSYHASYQVKGQKIIFSDNYRRQCRYVRVSEYEEFRRLHLMIERYARENIFLKMKGGAK